MKYVIYFFLLSFVLSTKAQKDTFVFNHLTIKNGLSQNSAMVFYQDRLGQMWIGTRDGLNKYDGTKITIYRKEIGNPKSISNDHILSLEEDDDGNIWIGTFNGLNRYDPKTDTFTQFFHSKNPHDIGNNTIWDIKKLSNGNLWIATDNGISVYKQRTQKFYRLLYQPDKIFGLRTKRFLQTKNGKFYLATTSGLLDIIDKDVSNFKYEKIESNTEYFINDLVENKDGNLLLATKGKSIIIYNVKKKTFLPYLKDSKWANKNYTVRALVFDNKNRLWAGSHESLLVIDDKKNIREVYPNILDKNAISKEAIRTIYKDNNNSVWIGTFFGGVNIWNTTNSNFRKIVQNTLQNNLNYNLINCIEQNKNYFFFGTGAAGISINKKRTVNSRYLNTKNSKLKGNNIKALHYSKDGKLWIAIFEKGIQVYNPKTEKFEDYLLSKELVDFVKNKNIYAIKSDANNNIWLGAFGKGIIKYNTKTKKFKNIWKVEAGRTSLTSSLVRNVFIDSKQNVWVGTQRGLNKIDENENIQNYFFKKEEKTGDRILCIYEDKLKNIWVSVKSKGLYKYDGVSFKPVDLDPNSLIKPSVKSILEDNHDNLWLSSNLGIIKYNTFNKTYSKYNRDDDSNLDIEFIENCGLKTGQSEFYFGGSLGVIYFNANSIIKNKQAAKVILTSFKVKDTDQSVNRDIINTTLPYAESINLAYNQGNFSLSFSSPNFINFKNNTYKYRLVGLEKNWNTTSIPNVSYTIQKAGKYVFEVKGANGDGVWNENITKLNINVAPAPWLTYLAFAGYILICLGVIYIYISILSSKAKLKHSLDIEQLEIEKTKELNEKKIEFFTNVSHDFRTPLSLILGPLQQITKDYRGDKKIYNKLNIVKNNANHLLDLVNKLMNFRRLETNIYNLEVEESNIVPFLKNIYTSFKEYAKLDNYTFNFFSQNDEILVYYDAKKLERLFYNLISNAFRYTPKGGIITINVSKQKKNVLIIVKDSGIGISKANLNKVFDRFFDNETSKLSLNDHTKDKGTGIGLSIAKEIVDLHKGEIKVKSNGLKKGTTFEVLLPLGADHLNDSINGRNFDYENEVSSYISYENKKPIYEEKTVEEPEGLEKSTLLIVEDHKQLRAFIKELFIEKYKIIEAENGQIGFKLAKKENPSLIISDIVMPLMSGTELCNALKQELKTSHIPIILLTSRSSLTHRLKGLEQGADAYLSKPFNIKELKITVYNLLNNRKLLNQKFKTSENFEKEISKTSSSDELLYKKAVEIVKNNIGNDAFDIAFFASELGVSRTMLFTKIKTWTNYTPTEFVNHFKMKLAAQLLEQGHLTISQISYRVGFKTPKYFSRTFRKFYNQNPSDYSLKFKKEN